ncbi:MAG TPA: M48 family metallopeptidase [Anaerolineales bacterium]|nr:M48 family metallopeptidase [Anaerolineales bacterium]
MSILHLDYASTRKSSKNGQSVIDYVIIHELCHLKYLHHEPEFYYLLSRIMPNWKAKKEKLDRFDFG